MANSSGRIDGNVHRYRVRVYYEDTDATGVVYYANYLKFTERARADMLRLAGITQRELLATDGLAFTVRRCEVDYLAPARLDDELEVHTRVLKVGPATINAEQVVKREGADLVRSLVRLACVNREGQPRRLPPAVRAALEALSRMELGA
ncbi:MAG: tol-pal system-associated acyl-CoA thioesterase [Proteobacteria bacterium]|nr:tol-pal system-associated acyl-CoA thioesterase [Pseudomonadota bacterium]